MKLLLKISYLGTAYAGYQVQPNGVTIQQKLNEAALAVFGFDCDIVGCSRTDSGVHADEFCATVAQKGSDSLVTSIPAEKIPQALSAHLPEDIRVFDAKFVPDAFHARYDVKEKEYVYRIYNRAVMSPFEVLRAAHLPQKITDADLARMREAAKHFLGEHDFSSYMAQGSKITDPVRTVTLSEVERQGDVILYRVRANGFLYNMVRILTGTLLDVALGKKTPDEIPKITEAKDRSLSGSTMPACGLYLHKVIYNAESLNL